MSISRAGNIDNEGALEFKGSHQQREIACAQKGTKGHCSTFGRGALWTFQGVQNQVFGPLGPVWFLTELPFL